MAGPLSRYLTIGIDQPLPSAVINSLQDDDVTQWAIARGAHVHVLDHFVSNGINGTLWQYLSTGPAIATQVDDSANGANGAIELTANGSSGIASSFLQLIPKLGVNGDFAISFKARLASTAPYTGGGANARFGLFEAGGDGLTASIVAGFGTTGGGGTSANWCLAIGVMSGSDAVYDLGVPLDTTYHAFDIVRSSGAVTTSIDGVLKDSRTFATSMAGTRFSMQAQSPFHASACGLYIDRAALWFPE